MSTLGMIVLKLTGMYGAISMLGYWSAGLAVRQDVQLEMLNQSTKTLD